MKNRNEEIICFAEKVQRSFENYKPLHDYVVRVVQQDVKKQFGWFCFLWVVSIIGTVFVTWVLPKVFDKIG